MTSGIRAFLAVAVLLPVLTTSGIARADTGHAASAEAVAWSAEDLPATPAAPALFEAEDARISKGAVDSNHGGFTGCGFVNFNDVKGAYIEWVINSPVAGRAEFWIRYANHSRHDRAVDITVDGEQRQQLSFSNTGSWNTWLTTSYTPLLKAGINRIRMTTATAHGGPNIDSMEGQLTMRTVDYQAEDAAIYRGVVESKHPGYTGSGYVNTENVAGGYVEWTVEVPATGWYGVGWVTANATAEDRTTTLTINGEVVTSEWLFRSVTGSWSTWEDSALTVRLAAGSNTIRLTANTADGGPNYDRLLLYLSP